MKSTVITRSLLFVLLITTLASAQFRRRPDFMPPFSQQGIYFETITVPDDSGTVCYIPFRLAYKSVVFIKEGDKFKASYSITAEAKDSLSNKVFRDIVSREIITESYDNTLSETDYSQGLISLRLPRGNYKITPFITDNNASKEQIFRELRVNPVDDTSGILQPVLTRSDTECNGYSVQLVNYEGQIPFSNVSFDLIIPVYDTTVSRIDIELINNEQSVLKTSVDEYKNSSIGIKECQNNIFVEDRPGHRKTRNFVYRYINKNLVEGPLEVKVSYNNGKLHSKSFAGFVRWFERPFSLINTSFSIRILKYITDENTIKDLTDSDEKKQYESLFKYWKTMDPTPETAYNELMAEYYGRVDYSVKNFSVTGSKNGAESDRGKIYIQFGKPDNILRVYDDPNNIKEIWTYKDPERKFLFSDKTGLGNFILSSNS